MQRYLFIALFTLGISGTAAGGLVVDKLANIISREVSSLTEYETVAPVDNYSGLSFSGFEMVVAASIGIEIPFLASFEIVPEIEFVWERVD